MTTQTTDLDIKFMKRAIELSEKAGITDKTGGVFGCVIAKDGKIISEGYNQVIKHNDPTWHGEMQAIREACKKLGSPHIQGAVLYTSAEPCPMCLAACYWAHIDHYFYAAHIEDALKYGDFKDVDFYKELSDTPDHRVIKSQELLRDQAIVIWKKFSEMPGRARY